ncbi:STAS domain-containing protein [Dethiosulfatarculus sandiegensis]|uniref:Anti-sigma factor antagonist n=1 Tax=Dethiosulfatarculus sandiegensis TaxID=1429043 RepID=A0A0D2JJD7_9BACT|nr:STAS domain-containing protein [Dethiosulfatarculus sandiegensis]KIX15791.1 anti-sigma factor antagonist [Dethiosulfatarculus sandiegensis]
MEFNVSQIDEVKILAMLADRLDAGNAEEFKSVIAPHLGQGGKVVLDISKLVFVDSSGLGAILSCLRKLTQARGDLKLCGMSKQVRLLFELVRMHRIVDVYNTSAEAVAAFED